MAFSKNRTDILNDLLSASIDAKQFDLVKFAIESGANSHHSNSYIMIKAVDSDYRDIFEYLLANEALVDSDCYHGSNLTMNSYYGKPLCAKNQQFFLTTLIDIVKPEPFTIPDSAASGLATRSADRTNKFWTRIVCDGRMDLLEILDQAFDIKTMIPPEYLAGYLDSITSTLSSHQKEVLITLLNHYRPFSLADDTEADVIKKLFSLGCNDYLQMLHNQGEINLHVKQELASINSLREFSETIKLNPNITANKYALRSAFSDTKELDTISCDDALLCIKHGGEVYADGSDLDRILEDIIKAQRFDIVTAIFTGIDDNRFESIFSSALECMIKENNEDDAVALINACSMCESLNQMYFNPVDETKVEFRHQRLLSSTSKSKKTLERLLAIIKPTSKILVQFLRHPLTYHRDNSLRNVIFKFPWIVTSVKRHCLEHDQDFEYISSYVKDCLLEYADRKLASCAKIVNNKTKSDELRSECLIRLLLANDEDIIQEIVKTKDENVALSLMEYSQINPLDLMANPKLKEHIKSAIITKIGSL